MFSARFFGELQDQSQQTSGERVVITVPCDLRYRDAVGALIQQTCQRLEHEGAETGLGFQVVSAFNEAFNNLVQYAYPAPASGQVDVELTIGQEELALELLDSGATFEFDAVESPDLTGLPETGLGIFIIRSFMTDVSYQAGSGGEKNRLRMIRRLGVPQPNDSAARND